jgi:hypothetical protein
VGHPVLEHDLAAQVQDQDGDVVDVELDPDAADTPAVEVHGETRPAHGPGAVDVPGADEPAVGELGHQAGHRGLVQAGLLRDTGTGSGTAVAQVPQDQAEVGAAHGGLIGGRGTAHPRAVVQPAFLEHGRVHHPRSLRCGH